MSTQLIIRRTIDVVTMLCTLTITTANGISQEQPKQPVIPDKYTNLKVLPPKITKAELLPIMKGFCITFQQRCSYCHVATDDLSSADFASDAKSNKISARELLRLIREVK